MSTRHDLPRCLRYTGTPTSPIGDPPTMPPTLPDPLERCAVWLGRDDEGVPHQCARPAGHLGAHAARVTR
jgi:hypothetical protein